MEQDKRVLEALNLRSVLDDYADELENGEHDTANRWLTACSVLASLDKARDMFAEYERELYAAVKEEEVTSTIEWHNNDTDQPERGGEYLVSVAVQHHIGGDEWETMETRAALWSDKKWHVGKRVEVLWWAELPTPLPYPDKAN